MHLFQQNTHKAARARKDAAETRRFWTPLRLDSVTTYRVGHAVTRSRGHAGVGGAACKHRAHKALKLKRAPTVFGQELKDVDVSHARRGA